MRRLNSYVISRKHMSLRTYPLNPSYLSSQSLYTAHCIWSVISSSSNLNRWSSPLGLFYHVPLKKDQGDWDWRLRFNDIPNAIGCTYHPYGLATIRRLLTIIGLFCRISFLLQGSFANETYNFKEPTNGSHPISFHPNHTYRYTHIITAP